MAPSVVLGVSGLYHDAAAALIRDGVVIAAAQEERFTRRKHDPSLPVNAIRFCVEEAGVAPGGIDVVAYYEKPVGAFVRVLKTFATVGLRGARSFPEAVDQAVRRKLWVSYEIERQLDRLGLGAPGRTVFAEHHLSHAAAAFYPSPYGEAAILTFDGVGEWTTTSIGVGRGSRIDLLEELRFPTSIGLLYSAFTAAAGFAVNDGEYKLMGLAPFGTPRYAERILDHVVDLRDDGSFTVDLDYFGYLAGRRMTTGRFDALFDGPTRAPGAPITRRECDLASSIQAVIEEIVLRVAHHAHRLTGADRAVLGGGVALNCVANGRLAREGPFADVWVQPAANDAGSALGCALWAWHEVLGNARPEPTADAMQGAFLGPGPGTGSTTEALEAAGRRHDHLPDPTARAERVAALLADGAVVAVCTGRMEFGPRALGHRSILADPRSATAHQRLNVRVKGRESFRPFAPVVLEERVDDWFEFAGPSPYMSFVVPVRGAAAPGPATEGDGSPSDAVDLVEHLRRVESPIPAVTHVDGSARIQTVDRVRNPELHRLLEAFERVTGCPVLVNTSFNRRDEPIVNTAEDAYRCFLATDIDYLLLEDCLLAKADQPTTASQSPRSDARRGARSV